MSAVSVINSSAAKGWHGD